MLSLYYSPEEFLTRHGHSFNSNSELTQQVSEIIERVRQEGDAALKFFTQKFDEISFESAQRSHGSSPECSTFKNKAALSCGH